MRTSTTFLILVLALLATGCTRQSDVVAIKLGHGLDVSHPVHKAMVRMNELLIEKSDSTMRIDVYSSGQLGSERETLELLQIGSLGLTKVSSSALESFVPEFRVFGLPFLFRDEAHRFAVLDGLVGRAILDTGQQFGLRGLTYYDAGTRSFYTKDRPVHTPDDLRGLKIRVQESPVAVQMVSALGGSPTPISWGELYTSLQQGIVDAAENNPPSFYLSRHYEVCRYFILDEHTAVPDVVIVSTTLWNDLTPQQRQWLQEAADESALYQRELWAESVRESLAAVEAAGVEIIRPDKERFSSRVDALYDSFRNDPVVYDLIRRIQDVGRDSSSVPVGTQVEEHPTAGADRSSAGPKERGV